VSVSLRGRTLPKTGGSSGDQVNDLALNVVLLNSDDVEAKEGAGEDSR
jgi:hypothetical protein